MRQLRPLVVGLLLVVAAGPAAGQTANVGANFNALTRVDVSSVNAGGFGVPPDTMGAAGPNHWVQYNNGAYVVRNKDGSLAEAVRNEASFWQNKGGLSAAVAGTASGDPRVQFDPLSNRWFVLAFTGQSNNNSILIARSDTANPLGNWQSVVHSINGGQFYDFPTLGIDRNGVYIGTNNFGGTFSTGHTIIPKADLLLPTPTLANRAYIQTTNGNTGSTIQGVNNFNLGQAANAPGQLFGVSAFVFNGVAVTPVNGPGAAGATLGTSSQVTVQTGNIAPNARQPDATGTAVSTRQLQTNDDRYGSSVYRVGNSLFGVRTVANGSRAGLRVTVLNASTLAVQAEATIGDATYDYYFGAVAANSRGDVVVGYTRSGFVSSGSAANRWPSASYSVGTFNGTSLAFAAPADYQQGQAEYNAFDGSPHRWGDYSAAGVDPADPGIFWTTQEFATNDASNNYGTRTAEIIPVVAGETRWRTAANGDYATAGNWFGGSVPQATDHVIYSRNGNGSGYTITLPAGTTTNNRASVRQGAVTLSIPAGATYSLTNSTPGTPSFAVADFLGTPTVTVSGGGTLSAVTTTVAARLNSEGSVANIGSLTVTGAGTTLANSGGLFLGGSATQSGGTGQLTVSAGGAVTVGDALHLHTTASSVTVNANSTLTVARLTNAAGTNPTVTLSDATARLTVNGAADSAFTGRILGSGAVTKGGAGVFTLGAAGADSTYSGGTTLTGGTFRPGAANVLPNAGTVVFNGGTLSTGSGTGVSEVLGTLDLDASSTIALGTGAHSLQFTGIAANPTGTLTVTGWAGGLGATGAAGTLVFNLGGGTTLEQANTNFAAFRASVVFAGQGGLGDAVFISTGTGGVYELVPTPEPGLLLLPAAGLLWLGRRTRWVRC